MDNEAAGKKRNLSQIIVGILIVLAGILILGLMKRYVSTNYPVLHYVWPLLFVGGLLFAFMVLRNPIISVTCAMLALFSVIALATGNNSLRIILGVLCIGTGLLFLFHLVANIILETKGR